MGDASGRYDQVQIDALTVQRNLVIATNEQRKRKRSFHQMQSPMASKHRPKRRKLSNALSELKICKNTTHSCEECLLCEKRNNEMQKRLDLFEVRRKRVNALDFNQLIELKQNMQDKIKLIEEAERRFVDNICKCIVCLVKKKNISFDGCEHICICEECERKMEIKQCPICRTSFGSIKKVK